MENRFISYSSADEFIIQDKESDRFLDKNEIVAYLNEQNQQITDLEAKLAESEKTEDGAFWFEKWQHKKRDYDSVYKAYIENCAEVDQLKQQLAEKDQAIEGLQEINQSLGQTCNNDAKEIERLREQLAEKEKEVEYQESMKILAVKNQNQTAIEKLQKVLEWLNIPFDENGCLKNGEDLENYIDQQIAELKGEKDGKDNSL